MRVLPMVRRHPWRWWLALTLTLLAVLGYLQRQPLLLAALNRLLAETPLQLSSLQDVHITRAGLQLQQAQFLLPARGESLLLTGLQLRWRRDALLALPQLQALHIASASLTPLAVLLPEEVAHAAQAPASLDLVGLLQTLRDFPLRSVVVDELQLPGHAEPLLATVTAEPGAFAAELRSTTLRLTLALDQAEPGAARLSLQASSGPDLSGQLEFIVPADLPPGQLGGSGSFVASGKRQGEAFAVRGALALPACPLQRSADCALQFDADATLSAWAATPADAAALQLEDLELKGRGTLALDTATLQWQLGAGNFEGSVASLRFGDLQLATAFSVRDAELRPGSQAGGSLQLHTEGLAVTTALPWVPAFDMDAALTLDGPQFGFDAAVLLRDGSVPTDLRVQGRHDLATSSGSALVRLAPLELAEDSTLAQRIGNWPYALDLVVGDLAAELQLQWQEVAGTAPTQTRLTGSMAATLDGVGAYYGTTLLRGLDTEVRATLDTTQPLPLGTAPIDLRVAGLDIGLPLQDLRLRLQLDAAGNALLIESLEAAVLGGHIGMQQQRFDFAAADKVLNLQVQGLRLEQVLALTGYEDVVVDGGISGSVPLHFGAAGIEVAGGQLHAEQPGGNIRYRGTLGQGDASLALVREALSNYRFDALDSSIDYSPDGELVLGMQLQGYNPDLENGRRVNLNLNLSNNVIDLLKSLQAGRSIEDLMQELYE
ncbi:MAG: intermembrane phospholipid transport protein YdbH family protein [Pseudohongiellaceae bacterium]